MHYLRSDAEKGDLALLSFVIGCNKARPRCPDPDARKLLAGGRPVRDAGDYYHLREPEAAYNANSDGEMGNLRANNE